LNKKGKTIMRNSSQKRKTAGGATASAARPKATASKGMKITQRVVDVRRHTQGYVAGGKQYSVAQMRQMVSSGKVAGVQVVGNHIQAVPGGTPLGSLPIKVAR
jgi:hypothetical protein